MLLNARLTEARALQSRRTDMQRAFDAALKEKNHAEKQRQSADSRIHALCREARCETPALLPEVEQQSRQRRRLTAECQDLEKRLRRLSAGATIDAFAAAAGPVWPFVASYLGALGAFFSGSATISNLTFAGIQDSIAAGLGLDWASFSVATALPATDLYRIAQEALNPAYAVAHDEVERKVRSPHGKAVTALTLAVAGLLASVLLIASSQGADDVDSERASLVALADEAQAEVEALERQVGELDAQVRDLREQVLGGFGSCSFDEPVADLRALDLLV